jgi:hypothetical protein
MITPFRINLVTGAVSERDPDWMDLPSEGRTRRQLDRIRRKLQDMVPAHTLVSEVILDDDIVKAQVVGAPGHELAAQYRLSRDRPHHTDDVVRGLFAGFKNAMSR